VVLPRIQDLAVPTPARLFKRIDIRERETGRVVLMTAYLLLIIAAYMIAKAARDSLFVSAIGPAKLPIAYLAIAAAMAAVSAIVTRAVHRIGLHSLIQITSVTAISHLLMFWWGFHQRSALWFYLFYVWVSLFGAITASQFWLLANYVFNPREARRLFGWLGAGGILGGIVGGGSTRILAPWLGTESLLLVCAGLMTTTVVILHRIYCAVPADVRDGPLTRPAPEPDGPTARVFDQILQSRHLSLMAVILTVSVIVEALIDYQYKFSAGQAFAAKDQLTAFFGSITAYIGVFSLLFQIFLTGPILKRFGAAGAILFLPIGLLAGSIALAIRPALWTAAALQLIDGGFGYSIYRSSTELLYVPIPPRLKNAVKSFLDTSVDRSGRALGGLLLLFFTFVLALSISSISVIASLFLVLWIVTALFMKGAYIQSFRAALEKKTIHPEALHTGGLDNATVGLLVAALSSSDERQVLYALNLLNGTPPHRWRAQFKTLIHHPSSAVRGRTLAMLTQWNDSAAAPLICNLLHDRNISVRAEAIHYLCRYDPSPAETLRDFLDNPDNGVVHAAIRSISKYPFRQASNLALQWGASARAREMLDRQLRGSSTETIRQAILTSGTVQYTAALPILVDKLQDFRLRADASSALLKFGPNIVTELVRRLNDKRTPLAVRLHIPKVLATSGQQSASDALLNALYQQEYELDRRIIKALNRMRMTSHRVRFPSDRVQSALEQEGDDYRQLSTVLNSLEANSVQNAFEAAATFSMLIKAIRERLEQKIERIFQLLALTYPPQDIHAAYYTACAKPASRPSAVEFLDNLIDGNVKPLVIPVIEEAFGLRPATTYPLLQLETALHKLGLGNDPWLQTIALDIEQKLEAAA
jgi:AAA family ATP:ADP antiporter